MATVAAKMAAAIIAACESFSGGVFKRLLIESNILNIKLDEEGGGVAEWDLPLDQSKAARRPHSCCGHTSPVVVVVVVVLGRVVGGESGSTAACRC